MPPVTELRRPFESREQLFKRFNNPQNAPLNFPKKWIRKLVLKSGNPDVLFTVWCNSDIKSQLASVWHELETGGHLGLIKSYDGCYVLRNSRGSDRLSMHAYGIAIDLNASTNARGTVGNMPPEVIAAFHKYGFCWGGHWKTKDPMHFEYTKAGL